MACGEDTEILILVTAEDGQTEKTYKVTIQQPCGYITGSISTDNWEGMWFADVEIYPIGEVDWYNLYGHDELEDIEERKIFTTNQDGSGIYEIKLVPGKYELLINKPGYLDYIVLNIVIEKGTVIDLDYVPLIAGDTNKDGVVAFEDLLAVNVNYDAIEGVSPNYSKSMDLNEDGAVAFEDLLKVNVNYDSMRTIISL